MTPRSLPNWLAGIVAELELDRPAVVTREQVEELRARTGVRASTHRIIEELHARGWLLKTGTHGTWEFIPGERAGAISSGDPFLALRATLEMTPDSRATVALGSALWVLDASDRAPDRHEVALPKNTLVPVALKRAYRVVYHNARLEPDRIKDLPVHRAATVLVHLACKPTDVRSWGSVVGALPELVARSPEEEIREELAGRSHAARVRFAYLVSGLAPDVVERLGIKPAGKVWFGPRGQLRRHNARWQVADTILPVPPPGTEREA